MTIRHALLALAVLLTSSSQAQQAATPQPSQVQQQPCSTASTPSKPTTKTPGALTDPNSKVGKIFGKYSPVDPGSIFNSKPKPAAPCPPAAPITQAASATRLPAGVVTTWLCNPIVTSTDASHTVTFITPDELTSAEPLQANAFEADGAKADPKAAVSCANLRRDPRNNKVFLAQ
jgi:hypothetical protein